VYMHALDCGTRMYDDRTLAINIRFCGIGNNPLELVASMQAQIASFAALPNFLHPACWPDYPCLYHVDINKLTELPQDSMFLSAPLHALRVPSLEDLSVRLPWLPQLPPAEAQCQISSLGQLTRLYIRTDGSTTPRVQALWEHTGALSSLQDLHIYLCESNAIAPAATFSIPGTWTALRSLTKLSLCNVLVLNPEVLLPLANLQALDMRCPAGQAVRTAMCLAQLSSLTALTVLGREGPLHNGPELAEAAPRGSRQGADSAGSSAGTSSTLQVLDISCCALADVQLQRLPSLTKLVYSLGPPGAPAVFFPGTRVKPLASLKLLRTLELRRITLTQEFCWWVLLFVTWLNGSMCMCIYWMFRGQMVLSAARPRSCIDEPECPDGIANRPCMSLTMIEQLKTPNDNHALWWRCLVVPSQLLPRSLSRCILKPPCVMNMMCVPLRNAVPAR
jgi:hypothetical protein